MSETAVVQILECKLGKSGENTYGKWRLVSVKASDGKSYKALAFDVGAQLVELSGSGRTARLTYEPASKTFDDPKTGQKKPYIERMVSLVEADAAGAAPATTTASTATPPPAAPQATAAPRKTELTRDEWEAKQALEFRRMSTQGAVKAAFVLISESWNSSTPPKSIAEASELAKKLAHEIFDEFFAPLAGGKKAEEAGGTEDDEIPF